MAIKKTLWAFVLWSSIALSSCWDNELPSEHYVIHSIQDATVSKTLSCLSNIDSRENVNIYGDFIKCYPFLKSLKTLTREQKNDKLEEMLSNVKKDKLSDARFLDLQNNLAQDLYLLNISEVQDVFKELSEWTYDAVNGSNKINDLREEYNDKIPSHLPRIVYNDRNNSVSNNMNTYYKLVLTDTYRRPYDLYRSLVHLWITPEDAQNLYNEYVHDIETNKDEN